MRAKMRGKPDCDLVRACVRACVRAQPRWYGAYAAYLVKYLQGMRAEGVTIDALSVQNEPLNPKNNPSMVMTAVEQAGFVAGVWREG